MALRATNDQLVAAPSTIGWPRTTRPPQISHIAFVPGRDIDVRARNKLWQRGWDFNHGTGHGIGYFLNVHEGKQPDCFFDIYLKQPLSYYSHVLYT